MASVSLSLKRGVDGFNIVDFTVGTLATNADDIELRFNLADANSVALTRKDVFKALEAFERAMQSGALITNAPPL